MEPFIIIPLPDFDFSTWLSVKVIAGVIIATVELKKNHTWLSSLFFAKRFAKRCVFHAIINPELLLLSILPYFLSKWFYPSITKYFLPYKKFPSCIKCNDTGYMSKYDQLKLQSKSGFLTLPWLFDEFGEKLPPKSKSEIIKSLKGSMVPCSHVGSKREK
jgi:hypothetical protein